MRQSPDAHGGAVATAHKVAPGGCAYDFALCVDLTVLFRRAGRAWYPWGKPYEKGSKIGQILPKWIAYMQDMGYDMVTRGDTEGA